MKIKRQKTGTSENDEVTTKSTPKITNDSDVDDLIGDMITEEMQLLLTRLLRKNPNLEGTMKEHAARIINSRKRVTPQPQSHLRALLSVPFQQLGKKSPIIPQYGQMGQPMMMGQGFQPQGNTVDLQAIRRKVRDAFKANASRGWNKRNRMGDSKATYTIDQTMISLQRLAATESVLNKGKVQDGLAIMDAITSEFVNRGTELGVPNCSGYESVLSEIASDWTDIFLFEELGLAKDERLEYAHKLKSWDRGASTEESDFSSARAAATIGWADEDLKKVLAGQQSDSFKEPAALTVSRLNYLERQKRLEEAINLAKHTENFFHVAKFSFKNGEIDEAKKAALEVEDDEKLFSLAQASRAADVRTAFDLAIQAIALPHSWSTQNENRTVWLIDLALNEKLIGTLVTEIETKIKHKRVQYEIAKMLLNKKEYQAALSIGEYCIVPYPEETPVEPEPGQPIPEPDLGRVIPSGMARWLWNVVFEMVLLDLATEEQMITVLQDSILANVDEISDLTRLNRFIFEKEEYSQVLLVGEHIFKVVSSLQKEELELQKKAIKEEVEDPNADPKPIYEFRGRTITQHYNRQWDDSRSETARQMLFAALDSTREIPDPTKEEGDQAKLLLQSIQPRIHTCVDGEQVALRPIQKMSSEKIEQVLAKSLQEMVVVNHLRSFAQQMKNRSEFSLAKPIIEKAQLQIKTQRGDMERRQKIREEQAELLGEQAELANVGKHLSEKKGARLKALTIKVKIFSLDPHFFNFNVQQFDNLDNNMAQLAVLNCLSSKNHLQEEKRLPNDVIEQTVLDNIKILSNPNHLLQLGNILFNQRAYELVLAVGKKVFAAIGEFQQSRVNRVKIEVPYNLLIQKQQELVEIRQQLPPTLAQELKKLTEEMEKLEDPIYYDPQDFNQYDNKKNVAACLCFRAAIQSKVPAPIPVGAEQVVEQHEPFSDRKITEVMQDSLSHLRNPAHIISFCKIAATEVPELELMLAIKKRLHEWTAKLEADREKREIPRLEYKALKKEIGQLHLQKKRATAEQNESLRKKELDWTLFNKLNSSYVDMSLTTYESYHYQMTDVLFQTLFRYQAALQEELKEVIEEELRGGDKMDLSREDADPDAMEDEKEVEDPAVVKANLEKKLEEVQTLLESVLKDSLPIVKNPTNLLKIGQTFKSRQQFPSILLVSQQVRSRLTEIKTEQDRRAELLSELDDILAEEAELAEQLKTLKRKPKKLAPEKVVRRDELLIQKDFFNIFPRYFKWDDSQFDELRLRNARETIQSTYGDREKTQAELELIEDISDDEKARKIEAHNKTIKDTLDNVVTEIHHPQHVTELMKYVRSKDDYDLALGLVKKALTACRDWLLKKDEYIKNQIVQQVLLEEEEQLELLRQELDDAQKKQLEAATEFLDKSDLPYYILNSSNSIIHNWKYHAVNTMLNCALSLKQDTERKIEIDASLTQENIQELNDVWGNLLDEVVALMTEDDNIGINNPSNLISMIHLLQNREEHERAITVGEFTFELVKQLREAYTSALKPAHDLNLLTIERRELMNKRQKLASEKIRQFRDLSIQVGIRGQKAKFELQKLKALQTQAFKLATAMIQSAMDRQQKEASKMAIDSQITDSMYEREATNQSNLVKEVVDNALEFVDDIDNLLALAEFVNDRLDYGLVVFIGNKCHELIAIYREHVKKIEALTKEYNELEAKNRIFKSKENEARLTEIQFQLDQLPQDYTSDIQLDGLVLRVTKLISNAAKIENNETILREETVKTFKIVMSAESFGEVKVLTALAEWPAVRKELLEYVHQTIIDQQKREEEAETDFNQNYHAEEPISKIRDRVDLLLNEGMVSEVVDVFPRKSPDALEMLERLYVEVMKLDQANGTNELEKVFPLVQELVVARLRQFEFVSTQRITEMAMQHHAENMIEIFKNAISTMTANITQKQYKPFATFVKFVRKRILSTPNGADEWDALHAEIQKTNKSKKKLVRILNIELSS